MKIIFIFLFSFLIGNIAYSQAVNRPFLNQTVESIKYQMSMTPHYYLVNDSTNQEHTVLEYGLADPSRESILHNRVLFFGFYFENDQCELVALSVFGKDAVLAFINKLDKTFIQVETSIWFNVQDKTAIRIQKIIPDNGEELDLYLIEIGNVTTP